jgi:hypothetical protein
MATIFSKIILLFSFLKAEDYFLSFSYTFKNQQIIHTELNYSKALTNSKQKTLNSYKISTDEKNLKKFFIVHKEEIIDIVSKNGIVLYENSTFGNSINDKIKITFPPRRFNIELNHGYVLLELKGD